MKRDRLARLVGPAVRAVASHAGLEEPLVRVKRALDPAHVVRHRRDNDHLRVALAMLLEADSSCVDVGAHRGEILSECVRLAPRGRHIAYEPLPELAAGLARSFPQVDVREAALSDVAGEREFTHVVSNPGWSGLRDRPYPQPERTARLRVRVERLDDALPDGYRLDFVKIDVEGAEREVLAGALETITRDRPVIAFEHGHGSADHYGTRPEHIFELLCGEPGLRIFDLTGTGPYSEAQFEEAYATASEVNFIAKP